MPEDITPTVTAPETTTKPATTAKPSINSLGEAIAAGLAKANAGKPVTPKPISTPDPVTPGDATQDTPVPDEDEIPSSPDNVVADDSSNTPELPDDEPAGEPAVDPVPDVSAEADSRYRELESRFIEVEPKAQAYDSIAGFLAESRVSNEDFQAAMLALKARAEGDYTAFQKHIGPWFDEVKLFTGDALPAELAKLVEAGECTPEVAKRLAAAEAQRQVSAKNAQRAAEQAAANAQQAHLSGLMRSFGDWLSVRQKTDTSFKPKAGPNARDGSYEYFLLKLNAEVPKAGIKDAASLAQLADRIYREASAMFSKPAPNGAAKVLRGATSTSTGGGEKAPKSLAEAIRMGVAQAGKRPPTI